MLLDATPLPRPVPAPGGQPGAARDPLAAYARDGFLVVPGLLDAAECARLCAAAAELPPGPDGPRAPVMNPHQVHPSFLQGLRQPRIVALLERLLGGPVSGLQSQYFPCVPGTPGFRTHQDNHYVEAPRDAFASAWAALDDAHADNGALIVFPGSQHEPLLPVLELSSARPHPTQAFNAIRQEIAVPAGYAPYTVAVPRGTVVFLHGHLLHGSHDNRSTETRRALLTTYVRRGASFRRGRSAQRSEIDVHQGEEPR